MQAMSLVFLALVNVAAAGHDSCALGSTVMAEDGSTGNYFEAEMTSVTPGESIGVTFLTGETDVFLHRNKAFGLTNQGCRQEWNTDVCPPGPDLVWAIYEPSNPSNFDDSWYEADILSHVDAETYNLHWDGEAASSQQLTSIKHIVKCDGGGPPWVCYPCVNHCSCKGPAMGLSGDPVVHIGGYAVKFELPMNTQTLLWDDHGFEIFGQANLVTPDKKSQWFSDFLLVDSGRKVATIQRKAIDAAGKERPGALNTLSLAIYDEESGPKVITAPGSYSIGNGINSTGQVLVKRKDAKLGPMRKEEVFVKTKALSFSIAAEMAKKFGNKRAALKYSHLDIQLHKMSSDVTRGIFAELFGFIPMSSKTASMIRSMTS